MILICFNKTFQPHPTGFWLISIELLSRYEATPSKSIRLSKGINGLSEVEHTELDEWWIFEDLENQVGQLQEE